MDRIQLTLSQIHPAIGKPNLPNGWHEPHQKTLLQRTRCHHQHCRQRKLHSSTGQRQICGSRPHHLDDTQIYTRLSGDITDTIKKTITIKLNKLHEKGCLSKSHYTFCLPPEDHRTSLMYFLIKLHKNPHSYRPTCSCVNSVTSQGS